ncbi:MAG: NADH-quinone oxidoreductase subunit NuoE [Bacteroidota bacterium]
MRIQRIQTKSNENIEEQVDLSLLTPLIQQYKNKKGNTIPILQGIQQAYGYIPVAAMKSISEQTGLKLSDMYGVASFYAQFRLKPVGKIIVKVCHGTACHVQNATEITEALEEELGIKDGETTIDRLFTLESVACLGCCSLAPVMMIGDNTYGKLTGKQAKDILRDLREKETGNRCEN